MTMPEFEQDASTYSPDELVEVRRMLMTAGDHVECPRCHADLSLGTKKPAADAVYLLRCRQCHCAVTVRNFPEEL